MRVILVLCAIGVATVYAVPKASQRISGGTLTNITQYPSVASLLYSWNGVTYTQACAGVIINQTSILSAAHCFYGDPAYRWRIRVGSSYANRGGIIHGVSRIIKHSNFSQQTYNYDIAILRTVYNIVYNSMVAPAVLANYFSNVPSNVVTTAVGWGAVSYYGPPSEQLRRVELSTINQTTCLARYNETGRTIYNTMLCTGWLDLDARDQCQGDDGGPLYYNGFVVGICSWGIGCGNPRYPSVNTRVSYFETWIKNNS